MSDIYQIGMKFALTDGVSAGLASIVAQMMRVEMYQGKIQKGFEGWNKALIGISAIFAGGAIIGGMYKMAEHGEKLLDQQDKLQRNLKISYKDVMRLQDQYYSSVAKQVPTSNVAGYLKEVNELRSVVGSLERAESIAPWSMQLESIIANATGKSAEGEGFKMWRALEMTGRTVSDPTGSSKLANALAQNIIGSGGKLDADTFQTLARRGGVSWAHADPRFIAGPLSVVAADLGGSTTGTALQTLYQTTSGATVLGKQQAQELEKLGMIKPDFLTYNKGGDVTSMKPGGLVGGDLAMSNPYDWVQKVLMPHLHQTYGNDSVKIEQAIAKIGRNRNVIRMLTMFSDPGFIEQIEKDLSQWEQTMTVEGAYQKALERNPKFIKDAFSQQYESMMQSIGSPLMMAAIPVMQSVTSMFSAIGKWANADPEWIKNIGVGLASLGAFMIGGGAAAILAAIGPAGWLIGGLTGLVVAFGKFGDGTALPKEQYDAVVGGLKALGGIAWDLIKIGFDALIGVLKIIPGVLQDVWQAILKGINWLRGAIGLGSVGGDFGGGSYGDAAERMRGMGGIGGGAFGTGGSARGFHSFSNDSGVGRGATGGSRASGFGVGGWKSSGNSLYDAIIKAEGTAKYGDPYNTSLGYMKSPKPLTSMTMGESLAWGEHVRRTMGMNSSAKGAFQIVNSTQRKAMKALGFTESDKFSEANQNRMADWIHQHQGRGAWEGFKHYHPRAIPTPPRGGQSFNIENKIHLDGKQIAQSTVRHITRSAIHPVSAPYHNGRRSWTTPDAGMLNV